MKIENPVEASEQKCSHAAVCFHCDPIEYVPMKLFHEMYSDMDQLRLCDRFFEPGNYDDIDPVTPLNGNMSLLKRYQTWRTKNGLGDIPNPNRPI
ncbi:MAG: hypothetical protein LBB34_01580 [Holosporales bacterium]|nr:hypothetical protein [Holosporales bacterium]